MAREKDSWLRQHWTALCGVAVAALWFYVQLLQWKKHGDDYMLIVANIVITLVLWAILIAAISHFWKMARRAKAVQGEIATLREEHTTRLAAYERQQKFELDRAREFRDGAIREAREGNKHAGAQAALLSYFAACAKELERMLEDMWHHWNVAGEKLVHPVFGKPNLQHWGSGTAIELLNERRDFMALYSHHISRLSVDAPYFSSKITECGYPCEKEYQALLADLREHRELLEKTSIEVWESGQPIK